MARYIDADALIEKMTEEYKKHYAGTGKGYDFTIAMEMVRNQPTAYDVDAVIAELEENSNVKLGYVGYTYSIGLGAAKEIVKRGGVQ